MRRASSTASAADLGRVRRQFEAWRRRRAPGSRIPEPLWAAAVELAQEHGLSRTAQALSLDYYSLKRRLQAVGQGRERATDGQRPSDGLPRGEARFVEMPLQVLAGGSVAPACTLQFEDGRGARLHMTLQDIGAGDLATLVRSLWSEPLDQARGRQR